MSPSQQPGFLFPSRIYVGSQARPAFPFFGPISTQTHPISFKTTSICVCSSLSGVNPTRTLMFLFNWRRSASATLSRLLAAIQRLFTSFFFFYRTKLYPLHTGVEPGGSSKCWGGARTRQSRRRLRGSELSQLGGRLLDSLAPLFLPSFPLLNSGTSLPLCFAGPSSPQVTLAPSSTPPDSHRL